jgi:hypothetical protein
VNIYNLFNSDAATGYESDYEVYRQLNGQWGDDNPATPEVEVNPWGQVTGITTPRFLRFTVSLEL